MWTDVLYPPFQTSPTSSGMHLSESDVYPHHIEIIDVQQKQFAWKISFNGTAVVFILLKLDFLPDIDSGIGHGMLSSLWKRFMAKSIFRAPNREAHISMDFCVIIETPNSEVHISSGFLRTRPTCNTLHQ